MAKAKKKLLPKDFEELLGQGDLAALKAVFETCDVNARGGNAKQPALAFDDCPDELARWLVAAGADLSAVDSWNNTPLHRRARSRRGRIQVLLELGADLNSTSASIGTPLHAAASSYNAANAVLLIEHGAEVDSRDKAGLTPLESVLQRSRGVDAERLVPLALALLAAGAAKTPRAQEFVAAIGTDFEFHRAGFNPDSVDAVSAALDRLYAIFEVPPPPRRVLHDGRSPIAVKTTRWQDQHQELWQLLVPSGGPAATVQGEVIRITGRMVIELQENGGANWDNAYRMMADAFLTHIQTGVALSPAQIAEAAQLVEAAKHKNGDDTPQLARLAVAWVLMNPAPIKLDPPPYKR